MQKLGVRIYQVDSEALKKNTQLSGKAKINFLEICANK